MAHALTLLSSSFVEEEHQTWYFYTQTAMLLLLGHALFTFREQCKALERHRRLQAFKEMNSQHVSNATAFFGRTAESGLVESCPHPCCAHSTDGQTDRQT